MYQLCQLDIDLVPTYSCWGMDYTAATTAKDTADPVNLHDQLYATCSCKQYECQMEMPGDVRDTGPAELGGPLQKLLMKLQPQLPR